MNADGDSTLMRLPTPSIINSGTGEKLGIGVYILFGLFGLYIGLRGGLALGRIRLTSGISGWRMAFDC